MAYIDLDSFTLDEAVKLNENLAKCSKEKNPFIDKGDEIGSIFEDGKVTERRRKAYMAFMLVNTIKQLHLMGQLDYVKDAVWDFYTRIVKEGVGPSDEGQAEIAVIEQCMQPVMDKVNDVLDRIMADTPGIKLSEAYINASDEVLADLKSEVYYLELLAKDTATTH